MNCPLCGSEFEKADESKFTGCGRLHNCNRQCCPSCGYELVKEAKVTQIMRVSLNDIEKPECLNASLKLPHFPQWSQEKGKIPHPDTKTTDFAETNINGQPARNACHPAQAFPVVSF